MPNKQTENREQFWRAAFARRTESGTTIPEFCAKQGLKVTAYYYWRRTLNRRDAAFQTAEVSEAPGLVPVKVVDRNRMAPVEVVVNQKFVIRVGEDATPDHLRRVLQVVAELG